MILNGFLAPPAGFQIGRMNLLKRLYRCSQTWRCHQDILDDPGDIEESDPSRQESRHRRLVGSIQHDRCKPTYRQSLSRQS